MQKLAQFIRAFNSRKKRSVDLISKKVETSDFWANLYSKQLQVYQKPQLNRVFASPKKFTPQQVLQVEKN